MNKINYSNFESLFREVYQLCISSYRLNIELFSFKHELYKYFNKSKNNSNLIELIMYLFQTKNNLQKQLVNLDSGYNLPNYFKNNFGNNIDNLRNQTQDYYRTNFLKIYTDLMKSFKGVFNSLVD